ncbi:uncharacterized protein LOC129747094 isoform X2 [Uranotaenia lowii]|uniref:uncharacterized protein LOC129747094 isoform X2 n=1 Tax=Uranotaenia lowii TaxID=190385 RepID=UPI00247A8B5A|nr:uncharacterized protein LOC129747094 isoform X2 [Uranotaenia lowii]
MRQLSTDTDLSNMETKRRKLQGSNPNNLKTTPVNYNRQYIAESVIHKIEQPAEELIKLEVEDTPGNMVPSNIPSPVTTFEACPSTSNRIRSYQDISQSPVTLVTIPTHDLEEHFESIDVKNEFIVTGPNSSLLQDDVMLPQNVAPQVSTTPSTNDTIVRLIESKLDEMEKRLKAHIETTIEKVVDACFQKNFGRVSPLPEMNKNLRQEKLNAAESHERIENERQLVEWNAALADETLRNKYLEYSATIITPKTYHGKGDNAVYLIADLFFCRTFWNSFTWTGINRGDKSSRGFREFGNILKLILDITLIGDSTYTMQNLADFFRTKLFRYGKSRAKSKMLRRSMCRPRRRKNKDSTNKAPQERLTSGNKIETSGETDGNESNEEVPVEVNNSLDE